MASAYIIPNSLKVDGLQSFMSVVNRYGAGLAQASRFLVSIKPVPIMFDRNVVMRTMPEALTFLCEQAELPGKALSIHDARYYGPNFKFPVQTEYTDITLTFLIRDEMYEKRFFDNWMMSINPTHTYDFMYKTTYATEISIIQYSMLQEISGNMNDTLLSQLGAKSTYMATLKKAFPINVAPMSLSWAEENFHRLQVTFSYSEWVQPNEPNRSGYSLITVDSGQPIELLSSLNGRILGGSNTNPVSVTVSSQGKRNLPIDR